MLNRLVAALVAVLAVGVLGAAARSESGQHPIVPRHGDGRNPYTIHDYSNHSCTRECDGKPRLCQYHFLLEHFSTMSKTCHDCPNNASHCRLPQCVAADGVARGVLTANRRMPGPLIDVCEGDTIEVEVDNRMNMGEATTIHWHGMKQRGSPAMDGTAMISQWPLAAWTSMKYRFAAADPGTHYWHAHSSQQRSEGLFGAVIVRRERRRDPHAGLYDHDLTQEHFILLSDWIRRPIVDLFVNDYFDGERALPDSLLVNGLGFDQGPNSPREVFRVEQGKRYRFRVLLNGIFNCPVYVSADGHPLTVIASDGEDVAAVEVDRFMIFSGERWDFVLTADKPVANYWIRFKGRGRCLEKFIFQSAILRYGGAPEAEPEGPRVTYANTPDNGRVLNGIDFSWKPDWVPDPSTTHLSLMDLKAKTPNKDEDLTSAKPDRQYYLSLGTSELYDPRFELPEFEGERVKPWRPTNEQLNFISSRPADRPLLTHFDSVSKDLLCNNHTLEGRADCTKDMCECIHLYPYKLGEIVEIVMFMYKVGNAHPMHMHGHSFSVVAMKQFHRNVTAAELREMDARGEIPRVTAADAVRKDTVTVLWQSVVVIRFRADNPGFWFFHCHIEFHSEVGMAMVLQEGEPKDMPRPEGGGGARCGDGDSRSSYASYAALRASSGEGEGVSSPIDGHGNMHYVDLLPAEAVGTDDQPMDKFPYLTVFLICGAVATILVALVGTACRSHKRRSVYKPLTHDLSSRYAGVLKTETRQLCDPEPSQPASGISNASV